MDPIVLLVLGIAVVVAVNTLAPRVGVAAPLVLVALGIGVSFLPFVPAIEVEPELVLGVVLPPLLYSAAVNMPTMDFRRDFRIISGLSVVLVVVSSVVIGFALTLVVPGLDLATGIALGAVVSPTDAVATSIVRKAGVSPRIVTVLEGESMLNDASALVLLRSAVAAMAVTVGQRVHLGEVMGDFAFAVAVAVAVGYVVGKGNLLLRSRIRHATSNAAISFIVPFVAYLPAEHLGASGLVAAVTAGLVTGHGSPRYLRAEDRMTESAVWRTIEMLLESFVFLLMGLELFGLVETLQEEHGSATTALVVGVVAATLVLLVRAAFVGPFVWWLGRRARRNPQVRQQLTQVHERIEAGDFRPPDGATEGIRARELPRRREDTDTQYVRRVEARAERIDTMVRRRIADIDYLTAEQLGWRETAVLVWAGMRGAVTLAAAQSLPATTDHREVLVLGAFVVAVGTLVVQGGTLPWLVRRLGITGREDDDVREERRALHAELLQVALDRLGAADLRRPDGKEYLAATIEAVRGRSLAGRTSDGDPDDPDGSDGTGSAGAGTGGTGAGTGRLPGDPAAVERFRHELHALRLDLLEAQREQLLKIRDVGTFSSASLDAMLRQLDADQIGLEMRGARG